MADGRVYLKPSFQALYGCRFIANTEGYNNSTTGQFIEEKEGEEKITKVVTDDKSQSHALSIYPNPSNGNFSLIYKREGSFLAAITIRDMYGKTVYQSANKSHCNHLQESIHLNNTAKEIYIVKIRMTDKIINSKIVIQQ